jgi:hypothetical protein
VRLTKRYAGQRFKPNLKQNPFKCYSSIVLVFVSSEQLVIRIKSGVPMYIGSLQQQPPLVEWQALTGSGSSITDKIQDQCSRDTLKNAEEVPMVAGGIERWSVFQTEVEEKRRQVGNPQIIIVVIIITTTTSALNASNSPGLLHHPNPIIHRLSTPRTCHRRNSHIRVLTLFWRETASSRRAHRQSCREVEGHWRGS